MKEIITTPKAPAAIGPYSQAVISNGIIYVSGQLPINPEDNSIPEDIAEQTRQSLSNIQTILENAGYGLINVVKATVYLNDMNEFNAMNNVYGVFFHEPYPARVAIEVPRLPKNVKVEIEVIASK